MAEDDRGGDPTIPVRREGEPHRSADRTVADKGQGAARRPGDDEGATTPAGGPVRPKSDAGSSSAADSPTVVPGGPRRARTAFGGGRYEVAGALGRGGFGKVYKAYDHNFGEYVAIKTINVGDLEPDDLPTFLEKFRREATDIRPLEHQGIVRVYDYGQEDGEPYIVMALVEAGTLRDLLRVRKRLQSEEVVEVGVEVAEALHYVHGRGILHRDIKPENIFCADDGGYKVGDFGIARRETAGRGPTRSTFRGAGTPAYMSPEQIASPSTLDGRSDLFSLCVVLYEALTGEKPFPGVVLDFDPEDSQQSSDRAQRVVLKNFRSFTPIRKLVPEVPKGVAAVIQRGLQVDAGRRYPDCAHLADALRAAPREERRRLPLVSLGVVALVAVAMGVVVSVPALSHNRWVQSIVSLVAGGDTTPGAGREPGPLVALPIVPPTPSPTNTPYPIPTVPPRLPSDQVLAGALAAAEKAEAAAEEERGAAASIDDPSREQRKLIRAAEDDYQLGLEALEFARDDNDLYEARDAARLFATAAGDYQRAVELDKERAPTATPWPATATSTAVRTPTRTRKPTRTRTATRPPATTTATALATPARTPTRTKKATRTRTATRPPATTTATAPATAARTPTRTRKPARTSTATRRPTKTRTFTRAVRKDTPTPRPTPPPPRTKTPTKPPNYPPRISGQPSLDPRVAAAGESLTVEIMAPSDPEGGRVTCEWSVSGKKLKAGAGCQGRWAVAREGAHTLTLVARDSRGNASTKSWNFIVGPPNAPTPIPGPTPSSASEVVRRWLDKVYCPQVDAMYAQRGVEGRCTWEPSSLRVEGSAPYLTVFFVRADVVEGQKREVEKQIELNCVGWVCRKR